MISTIRPLSHRSNLSLNIAHFAKRAGTVLLLVLCALAFVVMAATASHPDLVPDEQPPALSAPDTTPLPPTEAI